MMRWKKRIPAVLALVLTLAFTWLYVNRIELGDASYLTSLEMRWLDTKFRARGPQRGGPEVVIVGVDEKTLAQLGSARVFQRSHFAELISKLAEARPKAIGLDITFQEPDVSAPGNDRSFAEAIRAADSVVLALQLYLEPRVGPRRPVER